MKSLRQNAMRCWILRSEPAEMLRGFVTTWRALNVTVLVAPRAGLQLNEGVVVSIDRRPDLVVDSPARITRLHSRVVSIVWQDAGDLVGLAVRTAQAPEGNDSEFQLVNRTPSGSVS